MNVPQGQNAGDIQGPQAGCQRNSSTSPSREAHSSETPSHRARDLHELDALTSSAPPGHDARAVGHDGHAMQAGLAVEEDDVAVAQVALHRVARLQLRRQPPPVAPFQAEAPAAVSVFQEIGARPRRHACAPTLVSLTVKDHGAARSAWPHLRRKAFGALTASFAKPASQPSCRPEILHARQ